MTSPHPTARSRLAISLGVAGALALAAAAHGCAEGAEERLPPPDALATSTAAPCADGAKRTCYVTLGEAAGTVSCLEGSQVCLGGTWGECEGDRTFELSRDELGPLPPGSGLSSKALSSPQGCPFNVCNPFCRHFDEVPDGGLTARLDASPEDPGAVNTGPTVPYDWVGGTYTVLSPQATALMFSEPCTTGADCQLNTHCRNPSSGTCDHHVCEVGNSLSATCSDCVAAICAVDPDCCAVPPGPCVHDPCVTGTPLASVCDPCVTAVCAARPGCCTTVWDSTCIAEIATSCAAPPISRVCQCSGGEAASGGHCYSLNTNSANWTDARSFCRAKGANWDLVVIGSSAENDFVTSLLLGNTWTGANDQSTEGRWRWVDAATGSRDGTRFWDGGPTGTAYGGEFSRWGSSQPQSDSYTARDCASTSTSGTWSAARCSDNLDSLCEGPPVVIGSNVPLPNPGWDQECVDQVQSVCGVSCGEGDPPPSEGICTPWYPDETDPTCDEFDLAVGVGCEDSGAAIVTVCNHGQSAAPPGIKIVHWPSGASDFGSETPNTAGTTGAESCVTTEAVPRGWCVNVYGCFSGDPEGREIMVNPRDGSQNPDECHFFDNWGVFNVSECGTPVCSGNASAATLRPLNMYFIVDLSGSMLNDEVPTRWGALTSAMKSFFSDPGSAGLNVAMNFFPGSTCYAGGSCDSADCQEPEVPLGKLLADYAPTDAQEQSLLDALNVVPNGWTPTMPALAGALEWLRERQRQRPNEVYVAVMVSDGEPTQCDTSISNIAAVAGDYFDDFAIRTYFVGIEGVAEDTIRRIAAAGGGEHQAYLITYSGGTSVADQLVAALQSISAHAVSCDFDLPNQGAFDPALATVQYIASEPVPEPSPSCLAGQIEFEGHCYFVSPEPAKWSEAQANCQALGAGWGLAALTTSAEDTRIVALVQGEGNDDAWIGLTRAYGSTWLWATGEPVTFTHWDTGQPGSDLCGVIDESTGAWDTLGCTSDRRYVCEGPKAGDDDRCGVGELLGPDGDCFGVVGTSVQSFDAARAVCQGYRDGWDLANIASNIEQAVATVAAAGQASWIGAKDQDSEGYWEWLDGTEFWEVLPPSCRAGEVEGPNGNCFYLESTARTWPTAQATCRARGTNWDLAALRSSTTNTFVRGMISADAWVGGNDRASEGAWVWPDGVQFWSGGSPGTGCASGQVLYPGNGNCFAFSTTKRAWSSAQTTCRALGAGWDLAEIRDAAEQAFVRDRIVDTTWLGGSDNVFSNEGRWYWPNGILFWRNGSARNGYVTFWATGEPNDYLSNEDCLAMYVGGSWYDRNCANSHDSACEGPATTGGSAIAGQYTNWASSEPNDTGGSGSGDCMRLRAADGKWEDYGCDSSAVSVCEGPKTPAGGAIGGAYANWSTGEPDDGGGTSDCALLHTDGTWRDTSCSASYRALCRGPKPPLPDPPAPLVGGPLSQLVGSCQAGSDQQWYFDDDESPTALSVCPATCDRIKVDRRAKLAIEIGCYPPAVPPPERQSWVAPETYTEVYEAKCEGAEPQWDVLAYDAFTPGESTVEFFVRAASSEAALADKDFLSVAVAQSTPDDTQSCGLGGPPPCPVVLFDRLGERDARSRWLELQIVVTPSESPGGGEVVLNNWQVTYSCPDSY